VAAPELQDTLALALALVAPVATPVSVVVGSC
jgi:hypothetical protein